MFFVSLAAKIDPDDYAWLVFTRATKMRLKGYHQRHVLTLEKGDIFGVRRTRSNTYQLVKSDSMHILYRNIKPKTHDNILNNSIPYKGPTPSKQEVEEGFVRPRKVSTREPTQRSNKRTDDYFKPSKQRITEKYEIDQSNYQWRKLKDGPIRVLSKKQGKARGMLRPGDLVGMRFRSPARGGYVLLDGNVRVHVSHEMYTEIVHSSRVVPDSEQRSDVVDLGKNISEEKLKEQEAKRKKKLPVKRVAQPSIPDDEEEEPIHKMYDIDGVDEDFKARTKRRSNKQRNLRRSVRKLLEVPEQDTWVENENDGFEDEGFDPEDDSPTQGTPESGDEFEPEDDAGVEDEFEQEDVEDSEPEPEEDDEEDEEDTEPAVENLEPGAVFRMTKGSNRTFVVVDSSPMERNENLVELTLYDPSDDGEDDFDMYRLRLNVNMPMSKFKESAEMADEAYDPQKLKELQDSVEYADIKSISLVK